MSAAMNAAANTVDGAALDSDRAAGRLSRVGQILTIYLVLLSVAGIYVASNLTYRHYQVNSDPEYKAECNISEAVNCETVASSGYSDLFGVPISVWGLFAYIVLLGVALVGIPRAGTRGYLGFPGVTFLWSIAGLLFSGVMAYIAFFEIHSRCDWCMTLYVINVVIFLAAIPLTVSASGGPIRAIANDLRRFLDALQISLPVAAGLGVVAVALLLFYPRAQMELAELSELGDLPCGSELHTDEGFSFIGGGEAKVTVEEFSDYECPFCGRGHVAVRKLLADYGDQVRFVHRYLPLDQECNDAITRPFHKNACRASKAAICAHKQEKFWPFNDLCFANREHLERKHLVQYADKVGLDRLAFEACLVDPATEAELQEDIHAARGWGLSGTPSYVINGQVVVGAKLKEVKKVVDAELQRCQEGAASSPDEQSALEAPTTK